MKRITFSTQINAPQEKVWESLWNDANYRQWTTAFHEGSYAKSDWQEGSKIQFLGPNGDGMYALIDKKIVNKQMIFKHLGEVKNGVEEELKEWAGALESYFLNESNGGMELQVELDTNEEYEEMFKDMFPKALAIVKQIAEN